MKRIGYMVIEQCDDFEQPLGHVTGKGLPPEGLLVWSSGHRAIFPSRNAAKLVITITEHYRLAFGERLPERRFLKIVPVVMVSG